MTHDFKSIESILALDCGSTSTQATLIDHVGEEYRLVARSQAPSTVEPPWSDVMAAVRHAINELSSVTNMRLLDGQGQLVWGSDGPPLGGLYPTSAWRRSEIVAEPRSLALDELAPGEYTLAVGLYHPATLVRLPVTDAGGRAVAGDAVRLTRLTWP